MRKWLGNAVGLTLIFLMLTASLAFLVRAVYRTWSGDDLLQPRLSPKDKADLAKLKFCLHITGGLEQRAIQAGLPPRWDSARAGLLFWQAANLNATVAGQLRGTGLSGYLASQARRDMTSARSDFRMAGPQFLKAFILLSGANKQRGSANGIH